MSEKKPKSSKPDPVILQPAAKKEIDKHAKEIRRLYESSEHAQFQMGDELTLMYVAMEKALGSCTNALLAGYLKLDLSSQRISNMRATAAFFPPSCRDSSISFRAYEDARKAEPKKADAEKRKPRTPVALVEAIKVGEFVSNSKGSDSPLLTLSARALMENAEQEVPDVELTANGKDICDPMPWMILAAKEIIVALRERFNLE